MIKYDWSDKVILVVEDEHINFRYIQEILKRTNAEVVRAENGQEAIDIARSMSLDLILMDIKLPIMDGYEATRKIREFNANVPIIAQTAYVMSGEEEKTKDAGCNAYLTKPLRLNVVLETIESFFLK
ncbi:MAG: response regulator [Salinivirgaceae bacterium]|nr:response regulator [Salinivirgaceae bacterium]MDD4745871.1 response regulator [Salinivirgaceae bacterium]MDY0278937.1 response regulator [Salinivirgaceae bacterium]